MEHQTEVAIIGGGPAGLNAALVLGRARKQVVLIDAGQPRNRVTKESHGFLTRDGVSPGEFRRLAEEEVSRYPSVRIVREAAEEVSGGDGHFQVKTSLGGVYQCKKLLFAVGKKDLPLEIPGLLEVYGKSAFVCPYCDGWELRDQPLAVIASGERAFHFAKLLSGWTSRYTICTNGPDGFTDSQREELKLHQIPVYDAPIQSLESEAGMVKNVILDDGTQVPCTGIFFAPKLAIGSELPQALGCELTETGSIVANQLGKTSVNGVYSAGDVATEAHQLIAAAAMGALAAAAINGELQVEAWDKVNHRGTAE